MSLIRHKSAFMFFALALFFVACKNQKQVTSIVVPEVIPEPTTPQQIDNILLEYFDLKYSSISFQKYMYISVKHQKLYLIINDSTFRSYPISTAKNGIGTKANSNKTPYGLHTVKQKIGDGVPSGGILRSRIYQGKIAEILTEKENADKDYVTTRILWLQGEDDGLNKGKNVDSFKRYIYIHGTPEEGFIGEPASHGCIRMRNKDVIELYNLVEEGTPVYILEQ